jgi:ABC-2 type transport system permease protein
VVAVPATILGFGLLGLLFASTFVLYRNANALSNMLEWPVLLVTGMLVPALAASDVGTPDRLGARSDLGSAGHPRGGLGGTPWPDIGMTLLLGGIYLALGALFLRHFEVAARKQATLSLT